MKVTQDWLNQWANTSELTAEQISTFLTQSGLEVDTLEPVAPAFSGVVLGKITRVEPHPNADKLKITFVDIGKTEPLEIVCGAPNAREGIYVPTATVGAVLPGDFAIKETKLRGVASSGMLCSAKELGISEEASGLHELVDPVAKDENLGKDIRALLDLDDHMIEIELTPNRGDCLSIRGVARELSLRANTQLTPETWHTNKPAIDTQAKVDLQASSACPRFATRVIKNINPTAQTPAYIQQRLERVGIRTHSLVVDVTNYVMISLGQPMHGFDWAQLNETIEVRYAKDGEELALLNGKTKTLTPDTLIIADANGPLAIAGIMGGEASEVTEVTTDIMLEAAFFSPLAIAGVAREYGLHTDASHRFERGVSLDTQEAAIEWATQLIITAGGGQAGPIHVVEDSDQLPTTTTLDLNRSDIKRKLGIEISDQQVSEILSKLSFSLEERPSGWRVHPPAWRFDVDYPEVLIEELARITGYDEIPTHRAAITPAPTALPENKRSSTKLRAEMTALGYHEVVAYSFVHDAHNAAFSSKAMEAIRLSNPISTDMSTMRQSLLPGLMKVLTYNQTRQQERIKLFDMGLCFERHGSEDKAKTPAQEIAKIAGLAWGNHSPNSWFADQRRYDFYDLKGDLEWLCEQLGAQNNLRLKPAHHEGFHPGQCAEVIIGEHSIGVIGKIHPTTQKVFSAKGDIFAFELEVQPLLKIKQPLYQPLPKYPASRRDIAILVPIDTAYAQIDDCINNLQIDTLREVTLFDSYRGDRIAEDKISYAITLHFQSDEHTLTDEVIEQSTQTVIDALSNNLGAQLRDH